VFLENCSLTSDGVPLEGFTEDRTSALAKASDVSVRDGGTLFESTERVAREYRLANTTGSADQGVMRGRSGECRLKRTRELTHL
jgi:hypothetical protein